MRDSLQLSHLPSQSSGPSRHLSCLKYFLLTYLIVTLVAEVAWTFYSINALRADLEKYEEAGEWEPTFVREFFKSSKNFFLFDLIMVTVVLCVGLGAVMTQSSALLISFLVLFSIEWIFELIGVYHSQERQVVMYRMVPALLRPGEYNFLVQRASHCHLFSCLLSSSSSSSPGLLVGTICYLSAIKRRDNTPLAQSIKTSGA